MNPEYRCPDQKVTDRAAANTGDQGKKGERNEGLPLLRRYQSAGKSKDGHTGKIQPVEQGGKNFGIHDATIRDFRRRNSSTQPNSDPITDRTAKSIRIG